MIEYCVAILIVVFVTLIGIFAFAGLITICICLISAKESEKEYDEVISGLKEVFKDSEKKEDDSKNDSNSV